MPFDSKISARELCQSRDYVSWLDGTRPGVKMQLRFLQVTSLSEWFAAHREGWIHAIADVAPGTLVTFQRRGVGVAGVNFTGFQVRIGDRFRSLTADKTKTLQQITGDAIRRTEGLIPLSDR